MSSLNPENIFHQYKGVPPETEYRQMVEKAIRNLCNTQGYLRVKLVSMAILEALADISGGDAPLPLFMGDVYKEGQNIKRLEDYLPGVRISPILNGEDEIILQLLNNGRISDSTFDTKNSPLSLFIFQKVGPENIPPIYEHAKAMFRGDITAREFLGKLDIELAVTVAKACASMVRTRQEALLGFARSLEVEA